ncbi:unnamed protein product [Urochloa decumbens]|uniref:B box-type domain-containing protein n=1 Tax=Urochloa decumbens TaxID=240449 RepID=A0ABC9BYW1_9POAL
MSRWRLPRPVVGAKRIRRGSSVGGSKPALSQPNSSLTSHPPLLLPPLLSSLKSQHTTEISLRSKKEKKLRRKEESPVTARRSPRTRAMSASAAAGEGGGVGGKEKGPGGACELCGAAARVYCGADEATLCWGCDAQVHGANFLVARHARALLCRGCARPTPWRAAGPRLGPTASLCNHCVRRGGAGGPAAAGAGGVGADVEMGGGRGDGDEEDDDDGEDEVVVEDEEDEEEEEEGEGENQVVPWTEEEAGATPPPVASSTSSSSREAAANGANAGDCAKEDLPCSTSPQQGLCHYSSPARHGGGRSDEATSSRNGGGRFLGNRHRKRSPSDFLGPGSAQSGSGTPGRNCSNAGIGRNGFT